MSNDLLSCEALEKLIQQEIGELDQIQQKLKHKHDQEPINDDLLGTLTDSLEGHGKSSISNNSRMGFGRPKNMKSRKNSISKTPKRKRIGRKLNAIAASPMNIKKKNVRALVYQDKSAGKKRSRTPNRFNKPAVRKSKHPRELSISSDESDHQSVDSNQPLGNNIDDENNLLDDSHSPNRSSRTLKKPNRDSKDIKQIQRRKTKLANANGYDSKSSKQINKGTRKNSRSRLERNSRGMPSTSPIQGNRSYLKSTKSSHSRVRDKSQNQNKPKAPVVKYKKPNVRSKIDTGRSSRNLNKSVISRNKTPRNGQKNKSRSRTPVGGRTKTPRNNVKGKNGSNLQRNKSVLKGRKNNRKSDVESKKSKPKSRKDSLLDDDMFNNDDLFAKLNQLTKKNREIERMQLIEDGLVDDPEQDEVSNNRGVLSISDSDSEEYDFDQEIENRLKSKIQCKKTKNTSKQNKKQVSNKSFIEQQLQQFKEQRRRKIKPSEIDYDRLMNPKHKKKASEIKSECTFQPMLSKKSLHLANKLGNAKDRLYNKKSINYSRTPEKYQNKENTFAPKISAKSKYIDQKKGGHTLNRHERLLKMGEKYNANRKFQKKSKEDQEIKDLKSHSFKPKTSTFKGTSFDVGLAERASRWAEKRKEKVKRKKQEIQERQDENCSFKPKINQYKRKGNQEDVPESLYSSRFMQDGIKNYFTRLEQARKIKRDANDRLENWGRAKSTRKTINQHGQGSYSSNTGFQTPMKDNEQIPRSKRSHRPINNSFEHNSQMSHGNNYQQQHLPQEKRTRPYTDKSINDTIQLLRKNLQGINIHLGN